ncbi:MAG: uracil-DNA glycosylase family protein [Planctomycetota bacterium]
MDATRIARRLSREVDALSFEPPVTHVYNPLAYARGPLETFLERFARPGVEAMLIGMNPGPWGMAQTGVPFGEISFVRDWMGIEGHVRQPDPMHPKRPVLGFDCARSEGSGKRVWSWAEERFGTPEAFFERFFVWNYCPLCFLEESGRNRTPDKLPVAERDALFDVCDRGLARMVEHIQPKLLIGIGKFAETRIREAVDGWPVGTVLHPSPANPVANRGWAPQAERQLTELGIALPGTARRRHA